MRLQGAPHFSLCSLRLCGEHYLLFATLFIPPRRDYTRDTEVAEVSVRLRRILFHQADNSVSHYWNIEIQ